MFAIARLLKLATGFAVTALLATACYNLSRTALLADLGTRTAAVMVAHGITDGRARWRTASGWAFRTARLAGTADAATRANTRDSVLALPGIADAVWDDNFAASTDQQENIGSSSVDCRKQVKHIIDRAPIGFGLYDATILNRSRPQLDVIAQTLQRCPAERIAIIGHTAGGGATAVNLALSQARADAVVAALAFRGIMPGRMVASGRGNTERLDPGTGAEADRHNARIEFRFGVTGAEQEPRA